MIRYALLLVLLAQDGPAKLKVSDLSDTKPESFPGDAVVKLTVWNGGASGAREATVKLTLGTTLIRVRLPEAVERGAEDTYQITIPSCPKYDRVSADAVFVTDEPNVPAGELTDGESVDLGEVRFARFNDNSLRITGVVRNGLKSAIQRVKVTFRVGKSDLPVEVAPLKAGQKAEFESWIPDGPEVKSYTFAVAHEEVDQINAPPAVAAPVAKLLSRKAPPPDKDPVAKDPKPEEKRKSAVTVEVCGLTWIDGYTMVNKKFSGWTSFLRIAIKDADGKPMQPTGKFTAQLSDANNKSLGAVQRFVKKDSFGLDALKIEPKNADAGIVAFDKKTGELWIGIVKIDSTLEALAIDAKLELDKIGTWEWKGLADKYTAKAKPADKTGK